MNQDNTPRLTKRSINLKSCFTDAAMQGAWTKFVKVGMRGQYVLDLHDYYDFQRNFKSQLRIVKESILDGSYKPKPPLILTLEKKYGVYRRLQVPAPEDSVVLQTLVEALAPVIKRQQPSEKAFYSRSHRGKSEEDIDESFPYAWWELWPAFQKEIYQFNAEFDYMVVTDVANYYDNVSFSQLRNVIASYGQFDEGLLDFLFYMLESFIWRPDYLPVSGRGLPQLNFDAPRLLGHALLFEIDQFLHEKTGGNFVRWMDDIDFGVESIDKAKNILRGLDDLLHTRGLRLNMGKTRILSQDVAKAYFLPDENRYLTIVSKRIKRRKLEGLSTHQDAKVIRARYRKFLKQPSVGRWDKVQKRYFTAAGLLQDPYLEKYSVALMDSDPDIRHSVFHYYRTLGFSRKRCEHILYFYQGLHCTDDAAIFGACRVLVEWRIPPKSPMIPRIITMVEDIAKRSPQHLHANIWLMAKYGTPIELSSFIGRYARLWKFSNSLSRQVAAATPRVNGIVGATEYVERTLVETGQVDALRILLNFSEVDKQWDRSYIMHSDGKIDHYPLSKLLFVLAFLQNRRIPVDRRTKIREDLCAKVTDPLYLKYINEVILD